MAQLTIDQAFQIALQHQQAGRLPQAEEIYRQILARQPNFAPALHFLGLVSHQAGRDDAAVELIRRAIALNPNDAAPHCNLGRVLLDMGRWDEAIIECRTAIALTPKLPEAHYNLGSALQAKGQLDEAIAAYRQAISINPKLVEALNNLGNALKDKGQLDEAIAALRQAISLRPNYAEAHSNLGMALRAAGKVDEAIAAYRQAIALKPNLAEAHGNLGRVLQENGHPDEAIAACRAAIALKADLAEAHCNLANVLKDTGQLDAAITAYRQAMVLKPGYAEAHSNLVLALHYHPAYSAHAIAEEHRCWNRQHAEPLKKFIRDHGSDRNPDRRLRIGYVSADLRGHSVGRFLLPLLAHHDKREFEIFAYAQVPIPDAMTQRLRSFTDGWRSIVGLSDTQAADLIRQDRIDVLVDLSGHTADNRLLLFARKPAPVQVTYLGYPNTTGLSVMDYRLTDAYADPPGPGDTLYSEQLIRLPRINWIYRPPDDGPALNHRRAGPAITFGCFNNFAKVTEPMLRLWGQILRETPASRLLLKSHGLRSKGARQRAGEVLISEGIDASRLEFAGYEPRYLGHLALYNRVDIAFDPFPYHGTTTTCEALWMGVPVITLAGRTHVSRVGVSLLQNIGLAELIAQSSEAYQNIAVRLADDLTRLNHLRSTLRQRMEQSPLMDARPFARDIEAAYRQMWRTWCERMDE